MAASLELSREDVFRDFLEEVQSLDDFRAEYGRRHHFEALGKDDQDVRRLIEAMAYFSARSRHAATRSIRRHQRRALERLFPYLLSPMPAMAVLVPRLGANMNESRALPKDAEFLVEERADDGELLRSRRFRARHAVAVHPLHIVQNSVRLARNKSVAKVHARGASEEGWLLTLEVAADARGSKRFYADALNGPPLERLRLQLNPEGDVLMALRLFDAMSGCTGRVEVRARSGQQQRYYCEHRRLSTPLGEGSSGFDNPIEFARRLVHFPLSLLAFDIPLGGLPSEWDRLEVTFHLNSEWPSGLALADGSFLLNAVPVENLERATAETIEVDGTAERLRIEHPDPSDGLKVRSVYGVYRAVPDNPGAREVLMPNAISGEGYDIDVDGTGELRTAWLSFERPLTLHDSPHLIHVDAEWFNPSGVVPSPQSARVELQDLELGPMRWGVLPPLSLPADSPLYDNGRALEALLEMHGAARLSLAQLKDLLLALGASESPVFGRVPGLLRSLSITSSPDTQAVEGAVTHYTVAMAYVPPPLLPAARLLLGVLPRLLADWTGLSAVIVNVEFEEQPKVKTERYEWREG